MQDVSFNTESNKGLGAGVLKLSEHLLIEKTKLLFNSQTQIETFMQRLAFSNKNIQIKQEAHALWYSNLTKSLPRSSIGSADQQKAIQVFQPTRHSSLLASIVGRKLALQRRVLVPKASLASIPLDRGQ